MELLSQRGYARHRGCSQAAVWKAIRDGRISVVRLAKGVKINPRTADREWTENTDRSKSRNTETGDPKRQRPAGEPSAPMDLDGVGGYEQLTLLERSLDEPAPEPAPAGGNGGNGEAAEISSTDYARSRAERESALAVLAKLQVDERIGKLVDAAEVRLAFFNASRKARDELYTIPARIAPVLAALENAADLEAVLFDEIERVCKGLSDGNS